MRRHCYNNNPQALRISAVARIVTGLSPETAASADKRGELAAALTAAGSVQCYVGGGASLPVWWPRRRAGARGGRGSRVWQGCVHLYG
jgi:hypothetical protein